MVVQDYELPPVTATSVRLEWLPYIATGALVGGILGLFIGFVVSGMAAAVAAKGFQKWFENPEGSAPVLLGCIGLAAAVGGGCGAFGATSVQSEFGHSGESSIPQLLRCLGHRDGHIRAKAVSYIAKLAKHVRRNPSLQEEVLRGLCKTLRDEDRLVRNRSILAVAAASGAFPDNPKVPQKAKDVLVEAVPALIDGLAIQDAPNLVNRLTAGLMGGTAPSILMGIANPANDVRFWSAFILGELGPSASGAKAALEVAETQSSQTIVAQTCRAAIRKISYGVDKAVKPEAPVVNSSDEAGAISASSESFPCPKCGKRLRAPKERRGQRAKCPGCMTVVTIPNALDAP